MLFKVYRHAIILPEHFPMASVVTTEPPEVSDQELIARCRAGDESAFDELVRRHQGRAFNMAWQLLRNREDALEVAQDAFVRIYKGLDSFRGECAFTTWLHQIVVNLAHNKHRWWRRRGRLETETLDTEDRQFAAPTIPPDTAAAQREFVRMLNTRIAELPAQYREVLVLRNVEDLSYEEIAVVLQCEVGTVKSRIARAREALRESMKDERLSES